MKLTLWNKREISIKKKLENIAKEAGYAINAPALELALFYENITEESDISDEKLNQLCNRFLAEDILTMQDVAKALDTGKINHLLKIKESKGNNGE